MTLRCVKLAISLVGMGYFSGLQAKPEGQALNSTLVITPPTAGRNTLEFKIAPLPKKKLTHEAPWFLELKNLKNVELKAPWKANIPIKEYDTKIPGFTVPVQIVKDTAPAELNYRLRAFVCEDNKDRCYADIHEGQFKWQPGK